VCLACAVASAGSCASAPATSPLSQVNPDVGYRFQKIAGPDKEKDDTFVIVTISGGGMLAPAFAYGVLARMNRDGLLDDVDIISTVSAGSFVGLYYGLYGKEIFLRDFTDRVLAHDLQGKVERRLFNPSSALALSSQFGRSEIAAEVYDDLLFDGEVTRSYPGASARRCETKAETARATASRANPALTSHCCPFAVPLARRRPARATDASRRKRSPLLPSYTPSRTRRSGSSRAIARASRLSKGLQATHLGS
jgi:hypothetical protein